MKINTVINIDGVNYPIIRDMTPEEEAEYQQMSEIEIPPEEEIRQLKQQLADTDYKAIKYAEGWISAEDYAPIKAERQAIRIRINELEGAL